MTRVHTPRATQRLFAFAIIAIGLTNGCGGGSSTSPTPTPTPTPISVTVAPTAMSVQAGANQTFTATVANDTANAGVYWAVSGTGCSGATCGTVAPATSPSGVAVTYTAPASVPAPPSVTLTATSVTDGTKTAAATITVTAAVVTGPVSVTITPTRGGLVVGQPLSFSATVTNDVAGAGVKWSTSAGTFGAETATTATYVAPASPASSITITATSIVDATKSASATFGVTDLAGMTTYHNDLSRDGANVQEYALNTTNVAPATFGKLFSCTVDGAVYAQPLWIPNVSIGGGTHNVIVVATMRDSVYLFDADLSNCNTPYWHQQLIPAGETYGNFNDVGTSDIFGDIGITGTPVFDPVSNTIYLVSKTKVMGSTTNYHHRLHALTLLTGAETVNSPVEVAATVPGSCEGGTTIAFDPLRENQRPGLALNPATHTLYVGFASHGDVGTWHGWLLGYNTANLTAAPNAFITTPNAATGQPFCGGGIWMSGGAPAIDPVNNDLYLISGNGAFDPSVGVQDYGDSYLRLDPTLSTVMDYFAPFNQGTLATSDLDVGSSGTALLIDQTSGPTPHLLVGGSKASVFFVLNRDNLGKFTASADGPAVVQEFGLDGAAFSTPGFWNNSIYYFGVLFGSTLGGERFVFNPSATPVVTTPAAEHTPSAFGFAGATPSISASSANTDGIVWAIDTGAFGTGDTVKAAGPAILHAFDASNLAKELWNSAQATGGRDTAGNAVKFTVPTVANGKVYIGTRGSDDTLGGGTTFGELDAYGLLPN